MLRYSSPASDWGEALPIGNGRLGAMVFGRVHTELMRLNEDSVWYGGPLNRTPKQARDHLDLLRTLIRSGKHVEAERLVRTRFLATPRSARHYEPLGSCGIQFDYGPGDNEVRNYERFLNLENAATTTKYHINGFNVQRQVLASFPDSIILVRITSEHTISFNVSLTRTSDVEWETNEFLDSVLAEKGRIIMHATPGGRDSNKLCCVLGAQGTDGSGSVEVVGQSLTVTAQEALIAIAAHTTYRKSDPEAAALEEVDKALDCSSQELWLRHYKDWSSLYGRMSIDLTHDYSDKSTNECLKTNRDPGLVSLYYNYSRYLLLSCSRKCEKPLPATLQGIWNPYFQPPWGSKYTININLQMNYWAVHTGNLSECEHPLFDLLERMAVRGKHTAEVMYGCRGWCAHHNSDIWADTDPQDAWLPATLWPLGGAWLCLHTYESFRFSNDKMFLWRLLPIITGCVQFLLDFLVPSESGEHLVTNPSLSPENSYLATSGETAVFCEGSTIDSCIVRTLFEDYISISAALSTPLQLLPDVHAALARLPPVVIDTSTQTIQEWGLNSYTSVEPGHRHVSHLISLYPGSSPSFHPSTNIAKAATNTLRARLSQGGGHTGWSRAWMVGLWARLRSPADVGENIEALLRDSTLPNMLDTHPPFQIDGNFSGAAGILESLVQSHEVEFDHEGNRANEKKHENKDENMFDDLMNLDAFSSSVELPSGPVSAPDAIPSQQITVLRLLPACPASWTEGSVRGAKARGGFEVTFSWANGRIKSPVSVTSARGSPAVLVLHDAGEGYDKGKKERRLKIDERVGEITVGVPESLFSEEE